MNAAPMGTQSFVCFTAANPARVWAVLTGTHETGSYVYGLVTHSSWEADAPIHFRTAQSPTAVYSSLTGRVLHVQPLCRLSYLVQSGPEDPPVAALQALIARDEPALPGSSRTEMTSRSTLLGLTRRRK